MVPVGIVGLSPAWDARYLPALQSLRSRIAVRAVYDPVFSRAGQAAAEFKAEAIDGMRVLARRPDVKALIVFDTGWPGTEALHLLCAASRPIFVGGALTADDAALQRLGKASVACGAMIMPELGRALYAGDVAVAGVDRDATRKSDRDRDRRSRPGRPTRRTATRGSSMG